MKKTQKKVLGLLGLVIVAVVTVFAAFLPSPGTRAMTTVTDTVQVRVVGSTPSIDLDGIDPGEVSSDGDFSLKIPYENLEWLKIKVTYTDAGGNTFVNPEIAKNMDYGSGVAEFNFNTLTGNYNLDEITGILDHYGYGKYVIEVTGVGYDGVEVGPKAIDVETSPIGDDTHIVVEPGDDGEDKYYLDVDYSGEGGETPPGATPIDKIVVNVYEGTGEDKKKIDFQPPLVISPPNNRIEIPFGDLNLPDGIYTITVTAYDSEGNIIYKDPAYSFEFVYESGNITPPHTADTGGMMGNLNISRADYIITGLLVFGVIGVSGVVFIHQHDKKTASRRKR